MPIGNHPFLTKLYFPLIAFVYSGRPCRASCGFKLIYEGPCAKNPRPLSTSRAASLMSCSFQCLRRVDCRCLDYAPTTGRCRLYAERAGVVDSEPDADLFCLVYEVIGPDDPRPN